MKMPKAWPMLASALNPQLGWGAEWKHVPNWHGLNSNGWHLIRNWLLQHYSKYC